MIGAFLDSFLTRFAAARMQPDGAPSLATRFVDTPAGSVRVYDSGAGKPCVLITPDGPNVIEHYDALIKLLSPSLRVVCFDMPGFGYSLPERSYEHSLDQGASAVLGVLDGLGIEKAVLAFSCANGFYALRAARLAPERISGLILSQTPSLTAMHAWTRQIIPWPMRIPAIGQVATWLFRQTLVTSWYRMALPRSTDPLPFHTTALAALSRGACFCLAGVVQGLAHEEMHSLCGVTIPCTMVWGEKDHSHRRTDSSSLRDCVPHATIINFPESGHFPDIENSGRFADIVMERVTRPG